ncbi:hypothetical protein UXN85_20840 [Enterobacter hormaechei]
MKGGSTFCLVLLVTVLAHRCSQRGGYLASCWVAGLGWAWLIFNVLQVMTDD